MAWQEFRRCKIGPLSRLPGRFLTANGSGTIEINGTLSGNTLTANNSNVSISDGTIANSTHLTRVDQVLNVIDSIFDGTDGGASNLGTILLDETSSTDGSGNTIYGRNIVTLNGTLSSSGTIMLNTPDAQVAFLIGPAPKHRGPMDRPSA